MAINIDFRPRPLGFGRGLRALDDAVEYVNDQKRLRREEARQRDKDKEYARQNKLAERRLEGQEKRERKSYEIKISDRNRQLSEEIAKLVREGRHAEAEALAKSAKYVDPESGEERSIGFDRGGRRVDPDFEEMRLEEPKGGFLSRLGAGARAEPKEDLGGFARMLKPPTTPPDTSRFYRNAPPSLVTPTGERVEFDPQEGERARIAEAERTASRLVAAAADEQDPTMRRSMLMEAERIRATIPGASAQHLRGREGQEDTQAFRAGESEKDRASRERIAARRGAGRGAGSAKDDAYLADRKLLTEQRYTNEVQKVLQNYGFKDLNTQAVKFSDMAAQVAGASDNAALAAVARGTFVKMAQGGVGVISDSDMRVFWERIGGLGMRAQEAWQGYVDGTLSPDKKQKVEKAVRELEQKALSNIDRIGGAIAANLKALPGGEERIPRFLETYTPGYLKKWQAKQADQGKPDAIEAMDREADEWLKGLR